MAPFGRTFLKARPKQRRSKEVETPAKEIQVLVCQEEKVVCGVTKHTTCADVIQALLEDHKNQPESKRHLHGEPKEFCLLERWKGFERALPPLTRILRLWTAWGDERPFIQFILVKTSEFVPSPEGPKRALRSRAHRSKRWEQGSGHLGKHLPVERQKRMVKKAFRKLEKLQKAEASEGSEEIDKMVQLILSQDHTIRRQIHHIQRLDQEIDHMEQHLRQESSSSDGPDDPLSVPVDQSEEQLQKNLYTADGIIQLELQVLQHQELIDQLSQDIDLELRRTVSQPEELEGAAAPGPVLDSDFSRSEPLELDGIRSDLDLSMRAGLSLHVQTLDLEKDLQLNETLLQSRNEEYQLLIEQLSSIQLEHHPELPTPMSFNSALRHSQQNVGQLREKLSAEATDTDSDTGISSTHSQDSLSPCLDRPHTLHTEV